MTQAEIAALRGKVLMGASYGCPWKREIPWAEVAYQAVWIHLAHEELHIENACGKIRIASVRPALEKSGAYWVSRDRNRLWRSLRGVRVISASHKGESALDMTFADGTIVVICAGSTDSTPVADWPSGLSLLLVSSSGDKSADTGSHRTAKRRRLGTPYY